MRRSTRYPYPDHQRLVVPLRPAAARRSRTAGVLGGRQKAGAINGWKIRTIDEAASTFAMRACVRPRPPRTPFATPRTSAVATTAVRSERLAGPAGARRSSRRRSASSRPASSTPGQVGILCDRVGGQRLQPEHGRHGRIEQPFPVIEAHVNSGSETLRLAPRHRAANRAASPSSTARLASGASAACCMRANTSICQATSTGSDRRTAPRLSAVTSRSSWTVNEW